MTSVTPLTASARGFGDTYEISDPAGGTYKLYEDYGVMVVYQVQLTDYPEWWHEHGPQYGKVTDGNGSAQGYDDESCESFGMSATGAVDRGKDPYKAALSRLPVGSSILVYACYKGSGSRAARPPAYLYMENFVPGRPPVDHGPIDCLIVERLLVSHQ